MNHKQAKWYLWGGLLAVAAALTFEGLAPADAMPQTARIVLVMALLCGGIGAFALAIVWYLMNPVKR